ncbi:hypothetical protein O3P69_004661 [Scylla paramamosain]|uniref:Uncharacterized protein n=1 Tax=Scylla paramamosain TaxID=85552 RepID=A0AAW0UAJ5_SCYPA
MDEDLRPHSLLLEDLLSLTQPARNLLQAGLVFAVHHMNGQSRHARFSLQDDHLFLHSLQDEVPPPGAVTVTMQEVVPDAFPYEVFLDLAWPGTSPRRVVVRLSRDTPRGRQFLLLCTGQRGSCYANTRLLKVAFEGRPGDCDELMEMIRALAETYEDITGVVVSCLLQEGAGEVNDEGRLEGTMPAVASRVAKSKVVTPRD